MPVTDSFEVIIPMDRINLGANWTPFREKLISSPNNPSVVPIKCVRSTFERTGERGVSRYRHAGRLYVMPDGEGTRSLTYTLSDGTSKRLLFTIPAATIQQYALPQQVLSYLVF